MNATAAHLAAAARLYGPSTAELCRDLTAGVERLVAQLAQIRIDDDGALDRLDRFADQLTGLQRCTLRLRETKARESADADA